MLSLLGVCLHSGTDNIAYDLSIKSQLEWAKYLQTFPHCHYISIAGKLTPATLGRFSLGSLFNLNKLYSFLSRGGKPEVSPMINGIETRRWMSTGSDGLVSVYSQEYPRLHSTLVSPPPSSIPPSFKFGYSKTGDKATFGVDGDFHWPSHRAQFLPPFPAVLIPPEESLGDGTDADRDAERYQAEQEQRQARRMKRVGSSSSIASFTSSGSATASASASAISGSDSNSSLEKAMERQRSKAMLQASGVGGGGAGEADAEKEEEEEEGPLHSRLEPGVWHYTHRNIGHMSAGLGCRRTWRYVFQAVELLGQQQQRSRASNGTAAAGQRKSNTPSSTSTDAGREVPKKKEAAAPVPVPVVSAYHPADMQTSDFDNEHSLHGRSSLGMAYRWSSALFGAMLVLVLVFQYQANHPEDSLTKVYAVADWCSAVVQTLWASSYLPMYLCILGYAIVTSMYAVFPYMNNATALYYYYFPNWTLLLTDTVEIIYVLYRLGGFSYAYHALSAVSLAEPLAAVGSSVCAAVLAVLPAGTMTIVGLGLDFSAMHSSTMLFEMLLLCLLPRPLMDNSSPVSVFLLAWLLNFEESLWYDVVEKYLLGYMALFTLLPKISWLIIYISRRAARDSVGADFASSAVHVSDTASGGRNRHAAAAAAAASSSASSSKGRRSPLPEILVWCASLTFLVCWFLYCCRLALVLSTGVVRMDAASFSTTTGAIFNTAASYVGSFTPAFLSNLTAGGSVDAAAAVAAVPIIGGKGVIMNVDFLHGDAHNNIQQLIIGLLAYYPITRFQELSGCIQYVMIEKRYGNR
jgi:hypothetical protein